MRLFMDAEFSLSIGDVGMTPEEIAYNAEVLPANRRIAAAVVRGCGSVKAGDIRRACRVC